MSFVLISKMAKLKINHMRHTFTTMQRSTTVMPVLSQFLNNRLIGKEFSSDAIDHTRLKREDYKLTIHDIVFSPWQPLIVPNDWKDFNNGKEGVRRYRHEDLPPKHFAGLYELGVALIGDQDLGEKFDPENVFAIYLGQSVDLRSRLQEYGRSGGHLAPHGLYKFIFSEQSSIFFRYALWEAAAAERMLLSRVEYALNRCKNGERRQLELLTKLNDPEFMSKRKSQVLDQVVTRIKEEKSNNNLLTSIIKQMRPFG
ncbi:PREDICTED: protein EFFECTOR OF TRANSCRIPTION 3-like [Camelina sativa]|uniref:Protein EFFECTOR OF TRANSCRIPTION 3-like n=1 Tax=Camelina sativa TaxID=90675 RepID=A0ABM0XAQ5_CAMSA|nr:PREDICTED: protein EFFECTOR OF TRANSCRIPTION 3-like [Camelina sativa]